MKEQKIELLSWPYLLNDRVNIERMWRKRESRMKRWWITLRKGSKAAMNFKDRKSMRRRWLIWKLYGLSDEIPRSSSGQGQRHGTWWKYNWIVEREVKCMKRGKDEGQNRERDRSTSIHLLSFLHWIIN